MNEFCANRKAGWFEVWLNDYARELEGRVLTIVDASIPAGQQNKCIKDLVFKEFGFYRGEVYELFTKVEDLNFGNDPRLGAMTV